ncbi:MAG TPA: hypothetical protein VMA98_01365 [Candidatus Acidoferrales bacterium]|nr:hypothetical protein [Candidatus Acidoferrales bacterium]
MKNRSISAALAFALAAACIPSAVFAWGAVGHVMINGLAAKSLPDTLPAFVRSPEAIAEIAALGPEEDRIKDAGQSWDADNDPGHYLDIGDDGTVAGTVRLDALPKDMNDYAKALAAAGTDPYRAGFVPYTIMDGFERLRKDFAIWRVDDYLATHATTPQGRAMFAKDRALREGLTLRDIGDWGHFVGDGSQPLHITIHYNGWGNYPNPKNYTTNHIHSFFETQFVGEHAKEAEVAKMIPAYKPENPGTLLTQTQIAAKVGAYLTGTAREVDPLYDLYASGDFQRGSAKAIDFTDAQLARGATELRDLIALAWEDSLNAGFGYPQVAVRDILSGKVVPTAANQTP